LIWIKKQFFAIRFHLCMTGFAFETAFELVLFGLVPMVLIVGTVWILWHVQEKIYSDVTDIKSFLTFILVIDDAMNAGSGWSPILPLNGLSPALLGFAAFYIGLTLWLWSHWRTLRIRQRPIER